MEKRNGNDVGNAQARTILTHTDTDQGPLCVCQMQSKSRNKTRTAKKLEFWNSAFHVILFTLSLCATMALSLSLYGGLTLSHCMRYAGRAYRTQKIIIMIRYYWLLHSIVCAEL